jgi:hypothetical protein
MLHTPQPYYAAGVKHKANQHRTGTQVSEHCSPTCVANRAAMRHSVTKQQADTHLPTFLSTVDTDKPAAEHGTAGLYPASSQLDVTVIQHESAALYQMQRQAPRVHTAGCNRWHQCGHMLHQQAIASAVHSLQIMHTLADLIPTQRSAHSKLSTMLCNISIQHAHSSLLTPLWSS